MKKKIITTVILLAMAVSLCAGTATAADTKLSINDIIDNVIDMAEDFLTENDITVGRITRELKELLNYTDTRHIISELKDGKGESVTLKAAPVTPIMENFLIRETVQYQWFRFTGDLRVIEPIEGAVDCDYETGVFDTVGVERYVRVTIVTRRLLGIKLKTKLLCSQIYDVAFTGLPTVYLTTSDGKGVSSKEVWDEGATIRIAGGLYDNGDLEEISVNLKGRGNTSWTGTSKISYSLKFEKKQNLFGLGKDKKWALIANAFDKTLTRNWIASQLDGKVFTDGEDWNVTQIPVDLIVNGEYRGSYYLSTTIKIGDKRIDIPDISDELEEDVNGDGVIDYYDGGFVIEKDRMDETYNFTTTHGFGMSLSDPDLDKPADNNDEIAAHIISVVQTAEDVLYSADFKDPETGYAKYFDMDSFVDAYLIQEIAKNNDGAFSLSTSMYYDPADGKIHMAPVWDFDIAFGNINYSDCEYYEGLYCNKGWYGRMLEDETFAKMVKERWNDKKEEVRNIINTELPKQVEKISVSAEQNFSKWHVLGIYTWPAPAGWLQRTTYQSEVDYLVNWTNNRLDWLDAEFNK